MSKKLKYIIAVLAIAILICLPVVVFATSSLGSGPFRILVDDEIFELWAFDGDGPVPAFRLQDMAYIFRGTPAQFDIRTPPDDRWDFWIVRGAPYTPTGLEMSMDFEPRIAIFGSYGFAPGGFGFYSDPINVVIVGVDGYDEPATTIALTVIEDPDGTFFDVGSVANLLGVSKDWSYRFEYPYVHMSLTTGAAALAELPVMSPELVDILVRIGGHWVDRVHFYGMTIDESVVWPVGFRLSTMGFTDINAQLAPIRIGQGTAWWYPLSMRNLEDGYVELTIDAMSLPHLPLTWWDTNHIEDGYDPPDDMARFYNHRIVLDASQGHIEEITYFIDDAQFTMMRNDWQFVFGRTDPRRYTVGPAEGDGIVIRYVLGSILADSREFRIYRSTQSEERGELIKRVENINPHDRLLFEFVDATVEYGMVYYYSIYSFSERWGHFMASNVGGFRQQFVVDVNEVLGLPPGFTGVEDEEPELLEAEDETYETEEQEIIEIAVDIEPDETESSREQVLSRIWIPLLLLIAFFIFGGIVWRYGRNRT